MADLGWGDKGVTEREERIELAEWARATAPLFSVYAGKYERIAQILEGAAQPEYLSGCQLRGTSECQSRGMCQSMSCRNAGKVIVKRVCVEAKEAGILYPMVET
jgi:hypothetical protein